MKQSIMADFRSDHLAAKARGEAKRDAAKARNEMIRQIKEAEDPLQEAFELLVPDMGKADTVAGEMVRAMMKIMYRDYNDGDVFYEGYGIETCGSAVAYLCSEDVLFEDEFMEIAERRLEDDQYTEALKKVSDKVMNYLYENPKLFSQENDTDMYDYNGEAFVEQMDWEPHDYDFYCDYPEKLSSYIEHDYLDYNDIENEIAYWDGMEGVTINAGEYGIEFTDLTKGQYEEVERFMYMWLEQWGNDLENDFGDPDEDEDEDEW